MSRVAKKPIPVPNSVKIAMTDSEISVKGSKGELSMPINADVEIVNDGDKLMFSPRFDTAFSRAMSGTTRALVNNMVLAAS